MSLLTAAQIADLLRRHRPTDEQAAAIEAPLAPVLVVAGAGSGKTETMAGRVVWLLANGLVAPGAVLGLTFTRKAAGELELRVRRRLRALTRAAAEQGVELPGAAALGAGVEDPLSRLERPTISTYNAYAASLVADHALRLGLEPGTRLLTEAARWQLADEVVESWTGDLQTDRAVTTVVDDLLALAGQLDEHLVSPAEARDGIARIRAALEAAAPPRAEVAKVIASLDARVALLGAVEEFRERKRAGEAIDFGDQVALAARLAREVPEVGETERQRYAVVLLDEYQDTSYAQLRLLTALFGGGHPVTAVGDPHQSIYGWRGASAGGLERFPEDFAAVTAEGQRRASAMTLAVTFRNDRQVLAAANVLAGPLVAASAARGAGVDVKPLVAGPGAQEGAVEGRLVETVGDEAALVAAFVAAHWRGPDGVGVGAAGRGGAPVSAAVLCRKRSQFELLLTALRAHGLPVEVVGLGGLLGTPEVVDLVALLTAAHDPSRGDALMRLLTRARLGAADLHALAAWARHLGRRRGFGDAVEPDVVEPDVVDERTIVDAVDELPPPGWRSHDGRSLTPAARTRLADLGEVLRGVRRHTYLPLPELVGHAERLLGLDIEVAARPGVDPGRARVHLDAFAQVADDFARAADAPTLGAFLAWLAAADDVERGLELPVIEPDPSAVQLMTVHAAKGLEWDVVAVPGLVDGVLPAIKANARGYTDNAWLTDPGTLPFPLRGDARDLPVWRYQDCGDPAEVERRRVAFTLDAGAHELAEERRLAYVAVTRARHRVLLTAYRWGTGSRPRVPSPFLEELVEAGLVSDEGWAPAPADGAANPWEGEQPSAMWPVDPLGPGRRAALERAAAAVVGAGAAAGTSGGASAAGASAAGATDGGADSAGVLDGGAAGSSGAGPTPWDRLADRLLAEREQAHAPAGPVELPSALSASALVRLERDPAAFAQALRRPVPQPPSPQARLGTAFHAWVEGYFGAPALVDVEALPGADDDSLPTGADLARLREQFARTPWASLRPLAVETEVETSVDGYVLRCRMDAVFPDPEVAGGAVVVDWKTGAPPTDPAERAARELQLAVYRLAWSRWRGVPLERVRAAFCYVASAATVYPERLLDEEGIAALLRSATGS